MEAYDSCYHANEGVFVYTIPISVLLYILEMSCLYFHWGWFLSLPLLRENWWCLQKKKLYTR